MTDTSGATPTPANPASEVPPPLTESPATGSTAPMTRDPRRTRTGATWIGVVVFAVVLVLLLIFILQNTQSVKISYFAASGEVSLAVAMLLATVAGVLLTAVAGSLRIWQLRRHLRRSARR